MKYLNFVVLEQGLVPTKHLNHRGYSPINEENLALIYHDILDHGKNEDGSIYKEILAQGVALYRKYHTIETLSSLGFLLANPIKVINYKPSKAFRTIFPKDNFISQFLDHTIYVMDNVHYTQFENFWRIIGKGYDNAKRRKNFNIDYALLFQEIDLILKQNYKIGTKVKVPLKYIQYDSTTHNDL